MKQLFQQLLIICLLVNVAQLSIAQNKPKGTLVSGPAQMHTTTSSSIVWLMVKDVKEVKLWLEQKGRYQEQTFDLTKMKGDLGCYPIKATFTGLKPSREYVLGMEADGKTVGTAFSVKTFSSSSRAEWSFIMGSCALETKGLFRPFVGKNRIFTHMAKSNADFMLWLGDNSYYLPSEWSNPKKMYRRQIKQRWVPEISEMISSMPNYAIWDDHDFGPNDCFGDFKEKEKSLAIIKDFWGNPYYGTQNDPGNFAHFKFQQAEFFLMDDRYYRCRPGEDSSLVGAGQLAWLKEGLKASEATFKFIAIGSQVVNRMNSNEAWAMYPNEMKDLKAFIRNNKITGVVFLTGDRHHTELLVDEEDVAYPLYEYTSSPLTTLPTPYNTLGKEKNNPQRVPGTLITDHNFGKITVKGEGANAELILEAFDKNGEKVWGYVIPFSKITF